MAKKKGEEKKSSVSVRFVNILAIVSILGFMDTVFNSFFSLDFSTYIETLLFVVMGTGFIIESHPGRTFRSSQRNLNDKNFSSITTFIVGCLAIIAGILTIPQFNIQNAALFATKGITSIIAILFIVIQTWIIKK